MKKISEKIIKDFCIYMLEEEKSAATIEKYLRDIKAFYIYLAGLECSKEDVILYKKKLVDEGYAPRSINSMLASLNSFFSFVGRNDLKVKSIKLQRQAFCPENKEFTKDEYKRLVYAAKKKGN